MNLKTAGKLSRMFVDSKLTIILVIASIMLGVFAVWKLPREEEPQIKVPMIDVFVSAAGATPLEVENTATIPMEKLLWEIPDVEYVYSSSTEIGSFITVRYKVGTNLEDAIIRLNQKLQANFDRIPKGVSAPLIKPRGIDDVPVLALTLHSHKLDSTALRKLAVELETSIKSLPEVSETNIIGGSKECVKIVFDRQKTDAIGVGAMTAISALRDRNFKTRITQEPFENAATVLEYGGYFNDAEEIGNMLVGNVRNRPVYLKDIAKITREAQEAASYAFNFDRNRGLENAVTISVAKRPNSNAIDVVNSVLKKTERLKGRLIPSDVAITVSRDYGHTAADKSNELLLHMFIAVFGVALLILLFLGWRESLVVLLAIPSTLALTLFVFYLYGYTLNRITLFALIFSIGILVDDAIVVVENITRHMRLPSSAGKTLADVAVEATDEVGNSTILATWAVIAAILPMAFVGGLMGPYMRPIPIGSTAAMIFSLLIAFTVTPWAFSKIMRRHFDKSKASLKSYAAHTDDEIPSDFFTKIYMSLMGPLLNHRGWQAMFVLAICGLLAGAIWLVPAGFVKVKMLPFDNKSEFQVIVNADDSSPLEQTANIAKEMALELKKLEEVKNMQIYTGAAAPYNFSGLVRHYFLRNANNQADIQVNLVGKDGRSLQSHDIAKRARTLLEPLAKKYGVDITVAEVPPGPPVLQTIVAEIYGGNGVQRLALSREVERLMRTTEGVVDVYAFAEKPKRKIIYAPDMKKILAAELTNSEVSDALKLAACCRKIDKLHEPRRRESTDIIARFSEADRASPRDILNIKVQSKTGAKISLSELVKISDEKTQGTLYRKNLQPVVYVTADVAGKVESPAYALFELNKKLGKLDAKNYGAENAKLKIYNLEHPSDDEISMKWDGEWHITLEVFRDLGLAFAAVLVLIAILMIGWFKSYKTPIVVMLAIPFSLVGILPAHWALDAFFTATSMIGFMAGAGIVVRNSIILVDFIELRRSHGHSLKEAVVQAGALRFRPMLLTALAVVVGASVILADPIFQGLAISLMFGEIASLLLSRMAVPVFYYIAAEKSE